MKTINTRVLADAWPFASAVVLFVALTAAAGKPAPIPSQPVAIVYDRSGAGIYTMAADGSSQKCILPNTRKATYFAPSFSPDGQRLALFRSSSAGAELCLANSDGTGLMVLHIFTSNADLPDDYLVVWSPDATRLLFTSESRAEDLLYISIAAPQMVQAVPVDVVPTGTGLAISRDLDPITPGYQGKLALSAYAEQWEEARIAMLNLSFDAAGVPQLGPDSLLMIPLAGEADVHRFAWSPTGEMLAYTSTPIELLPTHLCVLVPIWKTGETGPAVSYELDPGLVFANQNIAWSPDGRYLAYGRSGGYNDLFRGTVDFDENGIPIFTEVTNLTNTPKGSEANPDWSPAWQEIP